MPIALENCVKEVLANPKFKPKQKGQSKQSAAYAVCTAQMNKMKEDIEKSLECIKEIQKIAGGSL